MRVSARWTMRNDRYVGRGWSKMSPSHTTTSGASARATSTASVNACSKSTSRWFNPSAVVTGRYDRPRCASPMAATLMSVDQGGDVGRGDLSRRGRSVGGAHEVVVEVDLGRHRERRVEVDDQALAGHECLDLGAQRADVLLGGAAQDVAILLVGQAQHEERVELAEQLVVEQLGLLGDGAEPHLELAAFARHPREEVVLAVLARRQYPLRLLEH